MIFERSEDRDILKFFFMSDNKITQDMAPEEREIELFVHLNGKAFDFYYGRSWKKCEDVKDALINRFRRSQILAHPPNCHERSRTVPVGDVVPWKNLRWASKGHEGVCRQQVNIFQYPKPESDVGVPQSQPHLTTNEYVFLKKRIWSTWKEVGLFGRPTSWIVNSCSEVITKPTKKSW